MKKNSIYEILNQIGVANGALKRITDVLAKEIGNIESEERKIFYVDDGNEVNYITDDEATNILEDFADADYDFLGNTKFAVTFDKNDCIVADGTVYLLGNYYITIEDEEGCRSMYPNEIEDLKSELLSRLVPFMLGDMRLIALPL